MLARRSLVALMTVASLFVVGSGTASAHFFLGHDSVDGNEIRYEDYTRWNDALSVAIAGWENLSGGVSIAPDSATTITDLQIGDYDSGDGRCGYYGDRGGADIINLNRRYFDSYSATNRSACMLHEWGHAHGLAHNTSNNEAMDDCPVSTCTGGTAYTSPQSHDRSDYYYLW